MALLTGNRVTLIDSNHKWFGFNRDGENLSLGPEVILPVYGEVYTIRAIGQTLLGATLLFKELRNQSRDGTEVGFLAKFFRRVTDITNLNKLLAPSPSPELEQLVMDENYQALDDEIRWILTEGV